MKYNTIKVIHSVEWCDTWISEYVKRNYLYIFNANDPNQKEQS
jgi:hypothetical protein